MKRYCIFASLFYWLIGTAYAQTIIQSPRQADSLRHVIATARQDTVRVNALNQLSRYYWRILSKFDSSLVIAREAETLAKRVGFRRGTAEALNNSGIVYFNQANYTEALKSNLKALQMYEEIGDNDGIADALNSLAVYYNRQGDYDKALECHLKALKIREKMGDKQGIAASLNNIAAVYHSQGKNGESVEYHFKVLRMREELGDKRGIAASLNNIALVYTSQRKYDEALEYHQKSLRIKEELGDKKGISVSLNNIATVYNRQDRYDEALKYHLRGLQLRQEIGDKNGVAASLNNIAITYTNLGDYNKSLKYYLQALRMKEELGDKDGMVLSLRGLAVTNNRLRNDSAALSYAHRSLALAESIGARQLKQSALHALSDIHDSLGQHKQSLYYYRQSMALKDSLVNAENLKKSSELKEQYEAEKREQKITLLNKEKALQESELERQKIDLARSSAEQKAQSQSILLLNNEKQVRELSMRQQEAALTEAHLREEQNKQALELATTEQALQRTDIARRRTVQWSLAGMLAVVVAAAVWLGRLYRQKLHANNEILRQQRILEDQALEIEVANTELQEINGELHASNSAILEANEEISRQMEIQSEQAREVELANTQLHEKNVALDAALLDLKRTQAQLVHSEKMAAVGQLTAGVMHEINNPNAAIHAATHDIYGLLSSIEAFFFSLLDETSKNSAKAQRFKAMLTEAKNSTNIAETGASRIKAIVSDLEHFTKHQRHKSLRSDVAKEIAATLEMFRYQFPAIPVHKEVPTALQAEAQWSELNQVLLSILVNAAEANATIISITASIVEEANKQTLLIRVSDNGKGMDEETRKRVFEPFFTTKPAGQGTGLGMSIAQSILEEHSGKIRIETIDDWETSFILELPQTQISTS
jgi:signal transduction histidine kinase